MNPPAINNCRNRYPLEKSIHSSRVFDILEVCEQSKKLMVGIYLVEKNQFLFCNHKLRKVLGEKTSQLMNEGWDFWFSLIDSDEILRIRDRITNYFSIPHTPTSFKLKYHISDLECKKISIKHEVSWHKLNQQTLAINYFSDVSEMELIERYCKTVADGNCKKYNLNISLREKEVLHLVADGFSSRQIADLLFISEHTAISHRKNLIEKFQVKNTAQLIKKASKVMEL